MRVSIFSLLASLGLGRIITIVLSASFVGVVVGYAIATLANEPEVERATTVRPAATGARPIASVRGGGVTTSVIDAALREARNPSGIRRRRARVTITTRLRNATDLRLPATETPTLVIDSRRVEADPAAAAQAGELLEPVPGRSTVTGVLRFETAGDVTSRLTEQRRAKLRIAGQTLSFKLQSP